MPRREKVTRRRPPGRGVGSCSQAAVTTSREPKKPDQKRRAGPRSNKGRCANVRQLSVHRHRQPDGTGQRAQLYASPAHPPLERASTMRDRCLTGRLRKKANARQPEYPDEARRSRSTATWPMVSITRDGRCMKCWCGISGTLGRRRSASFGWRHVCAISGDLADVDRLEILRPWKSLGATSVPVTETSGKLGAEIPVAREYPVDCAQSQNLPPGH